MAKIVLLVSVVGTDFSYGKGQEVECSEERAKDLIRGNHAVLVGGVVKPQPETPEKRFAKPETRKK
jgi:hypothetical protein